MPAGVTTLNFAMSASFGDGGPEMAPMPPAFGAPRKAGCASVAFGDGGPEMAPMPPGVRRAPGSGARLYVVAGSILLFGQPDGVELLVEEVGGGDGPAAHL